jgi:hypothetical protein
MGRLCGPSDGYMADSLPENLTLESQANDRKWRLFVCACCRRLWPLLEKRSREAVEIGERLADGRATHEEAQTAETEACKVWSEAKGPESPSQTAGRVAQAAVAKLDWQVVHSVVNFAAQATSLAEYSAQCDLMREVFGNPFRPIVVDAWLTPRVRELAYAIYKARAFSRMGELADALEQAGCTDRAILEHCRVRTSHVPGCWVLDMLLGRHLSTTK